MKSVTEYLCDLIAIPSVSSLSNRLMVDYIVAQLDQRSWDIRLHLLADGAGVFKTNIVALTGNSVGHEAELTLVCHTDTVPYEANWAAAVHPEIHDGRIYGRGSCDVKGFLACVLSAVASLDLAEFQKPLALVFTADEEVGCIGAKALASVNAFSSRYLIIGEPTGLCPVRAGKGYALATIAVRGAEAHSAFPSKGRSAIYDAARVVARLEKLAATLEQYPNPDFDPPFTTLNVGLIQGGTAKNIVAGECRLTLEWRSVPGQYPGLVPELIERELIDLRQTFPGLEAELEMKRIDAAFAPSDTRAISDLLESLTGNTAATISFGSEAAHLSRLTKETVVFGPGDMAVAHKTGEYVEISELQQCASVIATAITRLCR